MRPAPPLLFTIAALLYACLSGCGTPHTRRVLIFSRTAGYRHASIPAGTEAIHELGRRHGFGVEATEDAKQFNDGNLARFDAIVFLNTSGDVLDDAQQRALQRFIRDGRGYVGVHAAADTEHDWPWYGGLVGAYFQSHPAVQKATIQVTDRTHPATCHLPAQWIRTDEWYDFKSPPPAEVQVLASLDESSYDGGRMGADHAIAWCQKYEGGRAFYTGGGHTEATYSDPRFRQHLLGAIQWATGWSKNHGNLGRISPCDGRGLAHTPCMQTVSLHD